MSMYPGSGLGAISCVVVDLAIIGHSIEHAFDFDMCIISGTLATISGEVAGEAQTMLTGTGLVTVGWKGIRVTAQCSAFSTNGIIIVNDRVNAVSDEVGAFSIPVIKGSTVTISCPSFGKTVTVDTTGHDSIDLSGYF